MRDEKEEMENPIEMKMLYSVSLTVISEQEFPAVCGTLGLEGKTREHTVIYGPSAAQLPRPVKALPLGW